VALVESKEYSSGLGVNLGSQRKTFIHFDLDLDSGFGIKM
jgi:hypothetical protein